MMLIQSGSQVRDSVGSSAQKGHTASPFGFSSAAKEFATILHANANWSPKQTTFQTPWNCFLKTTKLPLISASPICFRLWGLNCLNLSRKAGEHAGCVNRAAVACFLLIDLLGYLGVLPPPRGWVWWAAFAGWRKRSWRPNWAVTAPCPLVSAVSYTE